MIIIAAANGPHSIPYSPRKYNKPTGKVAIDIVAEEEMLAHMYSPQIVTKLNTVTVAIAGFTNGSTIFANVCISPLPSTRADPAAPPEVNQKIV